MKINEFTKEEKQFLILTVEHEITGLENHKRLKERYEKILEKLRK